MFPLAFCFFTKTLKISKSHISVSLQTPYSSLFLYKQNTQVSFTIIYLCFSRKTPKIPVPLALCFFTKTLKISNPNISVSLQTLFLYKQNTQVSFTFSSLVF
jgi:hypothetical protein